MCVSQCDRVSVSVFSLTVQSPVGRAHLSFSHLVANRVINVALVERGGGARLSLTRPIHHATPDSVIGQVCMCFRAETVSGP